MVWNVRTENASFEKPNSYGSLAAPGLGCGEGNEAETFCQVAIGGTPEWKGEVASLCHVTGPDLGPGLGGKRPWQMLPPHLTAHQVLQPRT